MRRLVDALVWHYRAWHAVRSAKRQSEAALTRRTIGRILVVCYGNIYRSAFAGACLASQLGGATAVRSGGFHAEVGRPAPERHVALSARRGVDLSGHRSSQIAPDDLEWADLIVIMDRLNWVRVMRLGADPARIAWLGAFAPGPVEITDPYRMDDEAAAASVERLWQCCQGIASALRTPAMS